MTTIINDQSKDSTLTIVFDRNWRYALINDATPSDKLTSLDYDDSEWKIVNLPHYETNDNSSTCWYRKKIEWTKKPDFQQHVYLNFYSNEEKEQKQIPQAKVWLNETILYTGNLPNSIQLTQSIRMCTENILVICSKQGCTLSLHSRILMPSICVGRINYDDIHRNKLKKRTKTLDYTASFDDADGLIDVCIDSLQKNKKSNQNENLEFDENAENDYELINPPSEDGTISEICAVPRLAVLILIVGTRGDVQPFIALAKALLACGHRVRLATHEIFRKFVRENGIEFYPLAGDPADLMSFMVKNAGIVPSVSSIVAGDVTKSRRVIAEILASTWKACIADDDETGVPFIAEAIIANPPSYGHIHCAQKLQIPLHMMFTMPWTPTSAFPHPFVKVDYDLGPMERINSLSYSVIEMLTWSGLNDLINDFRKDILGLSALHARQAVSLMVDEYVPYTYCWSPSLVPKPADWGSNIDVTGFFFLDLATNYEPPQDLVQFLNSGDPPIYIGFGSITGHDPARILKVILNALEITGYRALFSGISKESDKLPDNVFRIGNCPHDWLFKHVAAVCHHGGAGTTAAGLRAGKPTIVVPFFGDQFFWGSMISKSGAGPPPIPGKRLNVNDLAEAFKFVHEQSTREAAKRLSIAFEQENGCEAAVQSFHAHLPLNKMYSDLEPSFGACFRLEKYDLKISRPVAQVLIAAGAIKESDLILNPTRDWRASMYDNRRHLPIGTLIKHGRKAFLNLFVDTKRGLKKASSSHSLTANTFDPTEVIVRSVGKSAEEVYIGCLSYYGEFTDALERLPKLYDPYSDTDKNEKPVIMDFTSGAKAAEDSVFHGFKDGFTGFIDKPQAGYEKYGVLGGAVGAAVAVPNAVIKPVVGTLASLTWLGQGVYASMKQPISRPNSNSNACSTDGSSKAHSNGSRQSSSESISSSEETSPAYRASLQSGLRIDICRKILRDFERIKYEHEHEHESRRHSMKNDSEEIKERKKSTKLKTIFQRQRSHSANAQ